MQVILMDKVVNLGNLGDVVKVKDGYARNFLIPTGRARRATQANMEAFAAQKAELERIAADKLADAQRRSEKLEGASVTISQKAGVDGRLFGSITNADIAEALQAQGHDVAKADVRLPDGPLKALGEYPVVLSLHSDVSANITVVVVGEQ
ncbi:ribosomal protein L9 [Thiobacillus denitrificans ATCC 25259]|uniref:Large ribosomal subunit protein bL9 n=1 Tax=Thiobacillus denitrificans (strain ATCC 25259 / T1) TaxID=292415 RepID=RL9_THIDA|nr:50S ribosomal protein L9 [Thiobacillus denitrificans]Q3SH34.1 RecName: Full=Large ribosomal subunit protein bL9; AltName: Full=50S ribosomal protein L9 [Thiobacillus denitrificans ATCC 25259]AAZ98055.1 ribosomal protein L9 [Thiobacillus denitrificans ATCC 25259]